MRKPRMRFSNSSVSAASVSADAVVSSAMAAFCWVAASSWFIDDEIERSVVSCSDALWAILNSKEFLYNH